MADWRHDNYFGPNEFTNMKKEHTTDEVNAMRERLHESEWEGLKDRDLKQVLWDGCVGWAQMEDDTVISHYTEHYGDLED